jgi:hypothetical protein
MQKQHIEFSLEALCDLDESLILTDKVKLKQILINLIGNAFKFTEKGKIEVGCKYNPNHELIFYVSDTGIGIPNDKKNLIFERFSQLNPGANKLTSGTGLGLSIVKGLVKIMGGEIWIESELNKGSCFYFTIPFKLSQSSIIHPLFINGNEKYDFDNRTILLVEDDYYNTEYLKEILLSTGLKILHTGYGLEAVRIATSQPIDIVLMDIRLPDIDGYEATRLIRQQKPNLIIIAQTAYASHSERQKALDKGCDDYISKPTKKKLLLATIMKHLVS